MISTVTSDTPPWEPRSRSSDGTAVPLLRTPGAEEPCVAVVDVRPNQSFDIPVDARDAMQVFHDPYPYAAECGLLDADLEAEPTSGKLAEQEAEKLAP